MTAEDLHHLASDWLFQAGAPSYIALAFGDWYVDLYAMRPESLRPGFSHALSAFWYDAAGMAARRRRGQEVEMWPGKHLGHLAPVEPA